ncbi:MAG: hypothetical protein ACLRFR_01485, partial [Clostridia bacterium]
MFKKPRVFTLGVACFLTAVTAFGALATLGGGAFLADNHAGFSASAGALTPQEKLLAGTGLDPENDPVVYTTVSGLEIKYANSLTNTAFSGYTYFTMGKYKNNDVNWVIIGYDPSVERFV